MSGEAWLYLFAVLINAVNLFLQVFFTIMYSDLEWYVTPLAFSSAHPPLETSLCYDRVSRPSRLSPDRGICFDSTSRASI